MSPWEIVAAVVVMAAGAAVQGSVGFGMNVVAASILIQIDPDLVPGPLLAASLVNTLLIARRDRSGIDRSALSWALLGGVPGSALGAFLLVEVFSLWGLSVFLASVILVAAALSIAPIRLPRGRSIVAVGGFVSGIATTSTGVGGPPLALALQHVEPRRLRGTLSAYLLLAVSLSLVVLAAWGEFGVTHLRALGVLVPGQLFGYFLSGRLVRVLDRGYTRPTLLAISVAAALSLLIRTLV